MNPSEDQVIKIQLYCPRCAGGLVAQQTGAATVTITCTLCLWRGASLWFRRTPSEKDNENDRLDALSSTVDRLEAKLKALQGQMGVTVTAEREPLQDRFDSLERRYVETLHRMTARLSKLERKTELGADASGGQMVDALEHARRWCAWPARERILGNLTGRYRAQIESSLECSAESRRVLTAALEAVPELVQELTTLREKRAARHPVGDDPFEGLTDWQRENIYTEPKPKQTALERVQPWCSRPEAHENFLQWLREHRYGDDGETLLMEAIDALEAVPELVRFIQRMINQACRSPKQ